MNLVGQLGLDSAREVLESSFAQFQADREVVRLEADHPPLAEGILVDQFRLVGELRDGR